MHRSQQSRAMKSYNKQLMAAISKSDSRKVTRLLEQGMNPNCLLECKVNGLNKKILISPLHLACSIGNTEIALQLLDNGANVNALDKYGTTPLFWAATSDQNALAMCQLLIQNNADINIRDSGGLTALHSASHRGKTSVLKLLLKMGADETILSNSGETSLDLAKSKNNRNCVKALTKKIIIHCNSNNNNNNTSIKKWNDYTNKHNMVSPSSKSIGEMVDRKTIDLSAANHCSNNDRETERETEREETLDDGTGHGPALTLFNLQTHSMLLEMSMTNVVSQENSFEETQESLKKENCSLRISICKLQKERNELICKENMFHAKKCKKTHRLKMKQIQQKINKKDLVFHELTKQKLKQENELNLKMELIGFEKEKLMNLKKNNAMDIEMYKKCIENGILLLKKMDEKHVCLENEKKEIYAFLMISKEKKEEFDKWLRYTVKLPQYRRRFAKRDYDRLDVVKHLDKKELKRIGIRIKPHLKCILDHIRLLKSD